MRKELLGFIGQQARESGRREGAAGMTTITDAALNDPAPPLPVPAFEQGRDTWAEEVGDFNVEEGCDTVEVADRYAPVVGQDLRQPRPLVPTVLSNRLGRLATRRQQRTNVLHQEILRFECHVSVGQTTTPWRPMCGLNCQRFRGLVLCATQNTRVCENRT